MVSVSAEQVTLQQKVVEFLLPLTFPQHLYLTLENSDHGVSLSWLDPSLPTPSQTSNPDDPPFPPPPPPPPPLTTTKTTETPIFQFKGSNTLVAPSSNQIALTLAMQNIRMDCIEHCDVEAAAALIMVDIVLRMWMGFPRVVLGCSLGLFGGWLWQQRITARCSR